MRVGSSPRWCHLVWTTAGRRPLFKIAAAAGFCERTLRGACGALGWTADTVAVLPDQVHALIVVPTPMPRDDICRTLRRAVTESLRGSTLPFPARARLWKDPGWCIVLASPAAATVVRQQIQLRGRHPADYGVSATAGDSARTWPPR